MLEGVYEGIGGGRMEMKALSPSGIKQMMAGAQAFGYADTLLNMAEFAKVFGSKQSVVGEQALSKSLSLDAPIPEELATGALELPSPPSGLSPYGAGKEVFALQPGALPELISQAAPAVAEGTGQASRAQMFGGIPQVALGQAQGIAGTSYQLPAFLQNLSGSKGLQINQKYNLDEYSIADLLASISSPYTNVGAWEGR